MDAPAALVVLCTAPSPEEAGRLARGLVEAHLAACVNILSPIRSVYRWEGEVRDEAENLLVIKTVTAKFEAVRDWLLEHHPYEVPEVIALPVVAASEAYLGWVLSETWP